MPRPALWTAIADTLRDEIAQGRYAPGARLPTETDLSARFGVNRHTVRHALAALVDRGLVQTRRGSGAFVAQRPAEYALGRRVRFHQNIAASGRSPSRRFTRMETLPATPPEAEALALTAGALVHLVEGVSLADGLPLALFRSVFPADALPGFPDQLAQGGSVTLALAACGVADYTRASTRITAHLARPTEAAPLGIVAGSALLRSEAVNIDALGRPVEYGLTWFVGDTVALVVGPEGTVA